MNSNKEGGGRSPTAITLGLWKRAPVAWSLFWLGRKLSDAGSFLSDAGEALMGYALDQLTARGLEVLDASETMGR